MKSKISGQYFDEFPVSADSENSFTLSIDGNDFRFVTNSGIFSGKKADFGSCLLIENYIKDRRKGMDTGRDVLDLGCGYGLIGIVIKRIFPDTCVTMADINTRAAGYAQMNAELNVSGEADIIVSDGSASINRKFDTVLLNPPVRAGKKIVFRLYSEVKAMLREEGKFYIVIQTKQGAASSAKELERLFGICEVIDISAGYRVFRCTKEKQEEV